MAVEVVPHPTNSYPVLAVASKVAVVDADVSVVVILELAKLTLALP